MMITKTIYNHTRGMDDEEKLHLDYDPDSNTFSIRRFTSDSYRKHGALKWDSKEIEYTIDDFLKEFPRHKDRVKESMEEIKKELAD